MKKSPSTHPIRVALVEDHTLLRESMKRILNVEHGISVVGDTGSRHEGITMIRAVKPDVLIQDICLGQDDGLQMLTDIKAISPATKCLILTAYRDDNLVMRAIRKSADGFLHKSCSMSLLIQAIRQVACGHQHWDCDTLAQLAGCGSNIRDAAPETGLKALSPNEIRIAGLIADGLTNREIGKRLHFAEKTIRNRVSFIMEKLEVTRRSKIAAIYAGVEGRGVEKSA